MIRVAIFDLDDTLINTHLLKEYLFAFLEARGMDREQAKKVYERSRDDNGKNKFTLESFKIEVKKEIELPENVWEDFMQGLKSVGTKMVIAGAKEVLQYLQKNNVPIYILTLGKREWQEEKIRLAGLDTIIVQKENVKCTVEVMPEKGKIKEIKEILQSENVGKNENVIFVNDKPDETEKIMKEFDHMFVFIRRQINDQRYADKDYEKFLENKNVLQVATEFDFLEKIKKLVE